MILLIEVFKVVKLTEAESGMVVSRDWWRDGGVAVWWV